MKKTPTHYSEMLDYVSISLSDFAPTLAFHDSVLPELGFMRCMAVNLDTKRAALVLAREGYHLEPVCHQP
ncbi:hypothetical protein [Microseira wollei]|nr:hypothetical protein [Microseira wollei]